MNGDDVLKHDTRRYLFEYISENPGATFKRLRRIFQINEGTLTYHLDRLVKEELIIQKKKGKERCYITTDTFPVLKKTKGKGHVAISGQKMIFELISENPGITRSELLKRSRQTRDELTRNLLKLKKANYIWRVKKDTKFGYEIITARKVYDEMILILIDKYVKDEIDLDTLLKMKKVLDEMLK